MVALLVELALSLSILTSPVYLYECTSLDCAPVMKVSQDEKLPVLATAKDGWQLIAYQGQEFWVKGHD